MLSTLLKLGEQLSTNRGAWEDIIDVPNTEKEKSKNYILYTAEIVLDLDQKTIYPAQLKEYDSQSPFEYKNIKIQGGNNKAIYVCAEAGKLEQIKKSLFGKDSKAIQGEFVEAIDKDFQGLKNSQFYQVLKNIFVLKDVFEDLSTQTDDKGKPKSLESIFSELLNLNKTSKVVLWCASVLSKDLGIESITRLNQLAGYDEFINAKFLDKSKKSNASSELKISYASGLPKSDVAKTDFTIRYSINKMFVKETKNYASYFDDKLFSKNYQVSIEEQLYLERASKYLLDKQQVKIAEVNHCIIPKVLSSSKIKIKDALVTSFRKSELLFQMQELGNINTALQDELENEIYWITFLGFESDGNFFKTINIIQDVSSKHLNKVLETFRKVGQKMKTLKGIVDWEEVMTEYGKLCQFNLKTIYHLIPQRKDKEKKNEALSIFKAILEKRTISRKQVFQHFSNLILCHKYRRYDAFKNVKEYGEEYFDFAIRDAVFKYLAFLQVLSNLNLLDNMEQNEAIDLEVPSLEEITSQSFEQKIEAFFEQMKYTNAQKAMFYLGRMLSIVAYIQKDKKKTVLEKVNFNGMDKKEIQRLRLSLVEKAKQYSEIGKVIHSDGLFAKFFDFNGWNMPEQEAVFFLLSGYSFGIQAKSK